MSITADQISFLLSGGTSNSNPARSIGGAASSIPVLGTLNNLFSDITSAEATAGKTDYRCFYIKNGSSSTLYSTSVYIDSQSSGGSKVQIGLSLPSSNTAPLLAVDTLAPSGVSFQDADISSKISIGDISAGASVPVWVKRTTSAGTTFKEKDTFSIRIVGKPFAFGGSSSSSSS